MKTFLDAMMDMGYDPPDILEDGRIHRFRAPDEKRGKKSAWYINFGRGGAFGDWISGETFKWNDGSARRGYSDEDTKKRDAEIFERSAARFNEVQTNQAKARVIAKRMWDKAIFPEQNYHPYLARKGIYSLHGTKVLDNTLLIPIWNSKAELVNLQRILPDGTKKFLYGGEIEGCYYIIGGQTTSKMWYLAEGFATACTVHELTGRHVIIAFNCGNMELVAQMWRRHKPIIIADNDHETRVRGKLVNPGIEKSMEVAKKFSLDIVVPVWPNVTDFNDLADKAGTKECKRQLKMRLSP